MSSEGGYADLTARMAALEERMNTQRAERETAIERLHVALAEHRTDLARRDAEYKTDVARRETEYKADVARRDVEAARREARLVGFTVAVAVGAVAILGVLTRL